MNKEKIMRKEPTDWTYKRETSSYLKGDYRSKFFRGKWEKQWLKESSTYATENNTSIYEAMWKKYNDKIEHMPDSLFKFFPFNQNSIKCVEGNSVYMNEPQNFNDPFDCVLCANENEFLKRFLITHLKKTNAVNRGVLNEKELGKLQCSNCKEYKEYDNIYAQFDSVVDQLNYDVINRKKKKAHMEIEGVLADARTRYRNSLKKLRKSEVRISSFSNLNEFKLTTFTELWAHYAQNHEGFCVEYDLSKNLGNVSNNEIILGGLLPCSYSAKQILLSKQKIYKYVENIPLTGHEKIELEKNIILSFLTKSSAWRYENEWRLVLPNNLCDMYDNMILFFPIKSIYLGCRMPTDNKEFIYDLSRRKGISVYNMDMHEYQFELKKDYFPVNVEEYFENKKKRRINGLNQSYNP